MLRRMWGNKKEVGFNHLSTCLVEKNKTEKDNFNTALAGLQELRDIA